MATAEKIVHQAPPPPPPDYVLTLSAEEAGFVVDVMNRIGGSPRNSAREYADDIAAALSKAGGYYRFGGEDGYITGGLFVTGYRKA